MGLEYLEVAVVPLGGLCGPCALKTASNGILPLAALEAASPAKALFFDAGVLGGGSHVLGVARAVALAEGVTTRDESYRLLVLSIVMRERGVVCRKCGELGMGRGPTFMPMRPKVVRISSAALRGSQLPPGPSGLT